MITNKTVKVNKLVLKKRKFENRNENKIKKVLTYANYDDRLVKVFSIRRRTIIYFYELNVKKL